MGSSLLSRSPACVGWQVRNFLKAAQSLVNLVEKRRKGEKGQEGEGFAAPLVPEL